MAVSGGSNVVYRPGDIVSFTTGAAVTEGRLVAISGDWTVEETAGESRAVVGVALQTSSAAGDVIPVQLLGYVFRLTASGAVAAGNQVVSAANGAAAALADAAGATAADINHARAVLGVALEAIADTETGRVLVGGSY